MKKSPPLSARGCACVVGRTLCRLCESGSPARWNRNKGAKKGRRGDALSIVARWYHDAEGLSTAAPATIMPRCIWQISKLRTLLTWPFRFRRASQGSSIPTTNPSSRSWKQCVADPPPAGPPAVLGRRSGAALPSTQRSRAATDAPGKRDSPNSGERAACRLATPGADPNSARNSSTVGVNLKNMAVED